jgi:hypothetical protein
MSDSELSSPELFFQERKASTLPNIFSELRTLRLNKRTNSRWRRPPLVKPFDDPAISFVLWGATKKMEKIESCAGC